jgi:hypothetical protein
VIANTSGWEMLTPSPFRATWNGGPLNSDLTIESPFHVQPNAHSAFVVSHFGGGVLTFHTGYLFRTEPGWDLWVGGTPNWLKHGIQPLTGIVETSWLPQPFTMNWRFTEPGTVSFGAGEPFGMVMPVPHAAVDEIEPEMRELSSDPELQEQAMAWQTSRDAFIQATQNRDPNDPSQAWQRHYFKGEHIDGSAGPADHIRRRRLKPVRRVADTQS